MNQIKLILPGLLALVSACTESANSAKTSDASKHAVHTVNASQSANSLLFAAATGFVAGIEPNQRPENAPQIHEFTRNELWRNRFLTGISKPIPAGLDFLDYQEAWYTPFNQPGMPGYYDLRHWHEIDRDSTTSQ